MPNVIEAAFATLKIVVDNEPKQPLHVGEVMNCWTYLSALEEATDYVRVGLNTTTDDDLRRALNDSIKICSHQANILKKFMIEEGVPLPPVSEPRPNSESNDIPLGVKLTDDQLANGLSLKFASTNLLCASTEVEAIRTDLALMFVRFQLEVLTYGTTLKTMMRKRGWIKVPPAYVPPGVPHP